MKIQPNSKLVMIGDSITDCGRTLPVGEGSSGALGNGYVSFVDGLLVASCPELHIRIVNMGISGNTVRDLKQRWQTDVVDLQPDWLSIFIGINDVWRHFDTPYQPGWQVSIDEYEQTLDELLKQSQPLVRGLVLMTPYFIEPNRMDPMRLMMDRYGEVVRRLAAKYEAVLVDTQAAFDAALQYIQPMSLAADRVHPNTAGHMILARVFLQALDFEWKRFTHPTVVS